MKILIKGLMAVSLLALAGGSYAKPDSSSQASADGRYDYIIKLLDPPLVHFDGEVSKLSSEAGDLKATGPAFTGKLKLRTDTPEAVAYKNYLDKNFTLVKHEAEQALGESLATSFRYYNLVNGFAARLTPAQASLLEGVAGIRSVSRVEKHYPNTYASPEWIGSHSIWNGANGVPANRGEGMVIGMIDSGINFDHPSFADIGDDGYNHTNPLGMQLGLCSDEEVLCNDKLIGIYDFTEEETKGKDSSGHGTHTASLAAGNVLNVQFDFASSPPPISAAMTLKGVASHANLVTYKVCREDDPETEEDEDGCPGTGILQALEQAVDDGVDVVNYSLGTPDQSDPWLTVTNGSTNNSEWFLLLREAGIFASLSAGNNGSNPDTIGSPAIVPWALAVGAISHDGLVGHDLDNLSGGDTTPPTGIAGPGVTAGTVTVRPIVHARDFGNALCGTGEQEPAPSGDPTCSDYVNYSGQSNPFPAGTFNGEIVVCDRGSYGRVEKGKNLELAGAGGYILANTIEFGEIIQEDEHCLPAIHVGREDGDLLRAWLDSGSGHMGRLGPFGVANNVGLADIVQDFSSRGPNSQFVVDVLKPNIVAPGGVIYGAGRTGSTSFGLISGTSMSAPHIAGAGALLKAANPSWTPTQIASALEITATNEITRDFTGDPATPFQSGNGRPVLGDAANAGLYLDVTGQQFRAANPNIGGNPKTLNLAGLVDQTCISTCQFTRTVTDLQGGGQWTVNLVGDADVQVSPSQFTLGNGGSQQLTIDVDVSDPALIGKWVFGEILLSNNMAPTAKLTLAVFSSGGVLPSQWAIGSDQSSGFQDFNLNGLVPLPQLTFTGGGLVEPDLTRLTLNEDPTNTEPFDGSGGTFVVWHEVTAETLYLRALTQDTNAPDIDLYVGRDLNGNNVAEEFETICQSISPNALENCEILNPAAGDYWVLVQSWTESGPNGDAVTLRSAVVNADDESLLTATGPGIAAADDNIPVRVNWDNVHALPGEQWWGGVAVGSTQQQPRNIGIIPVQFNRSLANDDQPLIMSEGREYRRVLGAQSRFDRLVIDVPANADDLTVTASAEDAAQNGDLRIRIYEMDFDTALASAPDVPARPAELSMVGEAMMDATNGPSVTVNTNGGRYYVVLENAGSLAAGVHVSGTMSFSGTRSDHHIGWWDLQRGNNSILQGIDFNRVGSSGFMAWYSYGDDNLQTWYFAQADIQPDRDIWTADLWRLTNDGTNQFITTIGEVSVTTISATQLMMSYRLYGQSGFDRAAPISETTCPLVNNVETSYSAHWFDGVGGRGGDTDLVIDRAQQQVHYFYDQHGNPRWVTSDGGSGPLDPVQGVLEVRNNCSLCAEIAPTITTVGTLTTDFTSESTGSKILEFILGAPLGDNYSRTIDAVKLSDRQVCTN